MYAGRVVETGSAEQVFTDPQHPYAKALSDAFPRIGDHAARYAPAGLAGDPPDPRDAARRLLVRAAVPAGHRRLPRGGAAAARVRRRPSRRLRPGGPGMTKPMTEPGTGEPLLEARGVDVDFITRGGQVARALDGADLSVAARRDRRPRGGVRARARPRWPAR